jgi:hypothetical protein
LCRIAKADTLNPPRNGGDNGTLFGQRWLLR